MIRAGIDIGTNTILLLVADVADGKVNQVIEDHVTVVRLGQGVDKAHAFHPEAMARARACFAAYRKVLDKYPGIDVRAVATSGSRDAKNSPDFFRSVRDEFGIDVRVISGDEEADLSFRGALLEAISPEKMAVLDIGGGSSEVVTQGNSGGALERFSFDMGCVRLTERFFSGPVPRPAEIEALRDFVRSELRRQEELLQKVSGKTLVGVAGTATYLASTAMGLTKFVPEQVHGYVLTLEKVQSLLAELAQIPPEERLGRGGMDKGRADVIVAGGYILEEVLKAAGKDRISISVRGLRFGAVLR